VKFRPKIENWQLIAVVLSVSLLNVLMSGLDHRLNRTIGICTIILFFVATLAGVAAIRSIYWELSPQCLILHKLWKRKQIPWSEVTEIGWLGNMSGTFRINIGHQIEDYDRLYIELNDQTGFIAALRKFAPHANFELE
jgi:hypothetical protein